MPQAVLVKAQYLILFSFLLTFFVITNAFYTKRQFYPSVVYLTKSNTSLAVLYVQAFVFVVLFGKLAQRIFLGQLRAIEAEVTFIRPFLLFLKCFHWLAEDRVDYMEQSPVLGAIFHARIIGLLSTLFVFDYLFLSSAYTYTLAKGASVQIVFGFEYAILMVSVIATGIKYILHFIEIRAGEQWENKGVCMLYSDLILGFIRLTLYMLFIIVMMRIHTFPLFAIRPMFMAMRAFRKSCTDVLESRRAIQNLNTMYPDLTADELANVADTTCIICREDMQVQQSIKRLACQHIFHKNCLRSWFQRQQTCPICRTTVLRAPNPPRAAANNAQPAAAAAAAAPPPAANTPPSPPPSSSSSATSASPPRNATTAQTTFSTATATGGTGVFSQMPIGSFPMVLPPFGITYSVNGQDLLNSCVFEHLAFPPPPLPPANFTGMSEENIRAMEGAELSHVQARIQCLRNVRTLLDASMIQMQQYMNIVLTQSNMENSNRLLQNLGSDLDQVFPLSDRSNMTTNGRVFVIVHINNSNVYLDVNVNDPDMLRRRRLNHYGHRLSPTSVDQNDKQS
ncbi:unnamed protein product [Adineta ricciae]|uniref:RING-type E3 ubiquitin transferase n=1 Tax=Adineta ricciae TaxID=249248 RepID=A0A813WP73_ADIRI|nr:unnamed protein product [Adineta ricciae]